MSLKIPSQIDLDRAAVAKGGLIQFLYRGWHVVENSALVRSWHLEEICKHLEAVTRGDLNRLVINVPPGTGKSLTVSVFWPIYSWIIRPDLRWMFASFDASLSYRDSARSKDLLTSDWFRERWPHVELIKNDKLQNTMGVWHNSAGGLRFSTSVGAKATGWHAHIQVVDDPTKPADVIQGGDNARKACERTGFWWDGTMSSRKAQPKFFARVIVMQRLHREDLAGKCLKEGGYTHLCLPMEYDPEHPCITPFGGDRRTSKGELLSPERYDREAVDTTKKEMGPRVASAQLQQNPTLEGGEIFKNTYFIQTWKALPAGAKFLQSWDCAFTDGSKADYVVGQVWAWIGAQFFLVSQVRRRMDLPSTVDEIRRISKTYPQATKKLVEAKANGDAVIQTLKREIPGLTRVLPMGGKEARANAITPFMEAGNVFFPEASFMTEFIDEAVSFPLGKNDDQIDCMTQALLYMSGAGAGLIKLKEAMAGIVGL